MRQKYMISRDDSRELLKIQEFAVTERDPKKVMVSNMDLTAGVRLARNQTARGRSINIMDTAAVIKTAIQSIMVVLFNIFGILENHGMPLNDLGNNLV